LSDQKLYEVKFFCGQRPALLDHVEMVEQLKGNRQLKLKSEDLGPSSLLNVSGGSGLQIQSNFGGGMTCRRGGVDGAS
jgi:hypothetical protein